MSTGPHSPEVDQGSGWPGLFLVGAAKAGTTSLHRYLSQHPDVFMSDLKEPHFFSCVPSDPRGLVRMVRSEPEYLAMFEAAGGSRVRGESSTSYLWDAAAAGRIHESVPDARIVILLRDPIDRAYSHYLMDVREGLESGSFEEVVRRDWESPRKGWGVSHLYVELGLYAESVERFRTTFGAERTLVLMFEDLVADPRSVLAHVAAFLDLDPAGMATVDLEVVHNPYAAPRTRLAAEILGSRRFTSLRRRLAPGFRKFVRHQLLLARRDKPAIEPETERFLISLFEKDVQRLERVLGYHPPWSRFSIRNS